jgi:CheY-like chemotaxis protein
MPLAWIVDDDAEMGEAIRLMLELMDYQVTIFSEARSAAKSLLDGTHPDVMILDIMMPGVTGIDMLEFLRQRPELESIPVVMLSSETTDVQVDEAMSLGADGFVFKPVTLEELESAIQQAMRGH